MASTAAVAGATTTTTGSAPAATGKSAAKPVLLQPCVCPGHQKDITEIDFSPVTDDGVFFVSACADKLPMLRDGNSGDWIGTFEGHKGAVWASKLNKSATRVATGSADWSASLWDSITGDRLATWEHKHVVKTVAFSYDEKHLVTGGNDKTVRIFDVEKTTAKPTSWDHGTKITRACYSADSKQIITGDTEGLLRVWDVASGKVAKKIQLPAAVSDLELSLTQGILTVTSGKHVTFFDAKSYDVRHSHALDVQLNAATLHPTESKFVAAGKEVWVKMYDLHSGAELACNKGHHGPVHAVRFHPQGHMYASGSGDATIRLWPTAVAKPAP